MNYPSTLSNPMLKRKPNHLNPESIKFSNLNRPITAPEYKVKSPFSSLREKGKRISYPLPINHNYYNASKAELLLESDSENEESGAESIKLPVQKNQFSNDPYDLVKYHTPFPLQKNVSVYSLERKTELPVIDAAGYSTTLPLGFDYVKKSAGMLTTTPYEERVSIMNRLNQKSQYLSSMKPMAAYLGKKPEPGKDPYNRRKVKQLNDISFESDDAPEEIKNLRRLPEGVLTEENLK